MSLVDTYSKHFQSYRHNVSDKARQYASGLMQAGSRKNMDRMAEVVPEAKSRNLQQFLTHSKWNHRDVIDHVAHDVDKLLGDDRNACLLIDESGFAKQGRGSVGVARQWLGRLGKVDNGQVAVFGALAKGRYAAPLTRVCTCLKNGPMTRNVACTLVYHKENGGFERNLSLRCRL